MDKKVRDKTKSADLQRSACLLRDNQDDTMMRMDHDDVSPASSQINWQIKWQAELAEDIIRLIRQRTTRLTRLSTLFHVD